MSNLLLLDPCVDSYQDIAVEGVHYFHAPNWKSKPTDYLWLVWLEGTVEIRKAGYFLDDDGYEQEDFFIDVKKKIKGMIELQQSPYDSKVMWLKFFEVTSEFKGQGFSKEMIPEFVRVFKERYSDKVLHRSRPSEEGSARLKDNFTKALDSANIHWTATKEY